MAPVYNIIDFGIYACIHILMPECVELWYDDTCLYSYRLIPVCISYCINSYSYGLQYKHLYTYPNTSIPDNWWITGHVWTCLSQSARHILYVSGGGLVSDTVIAKLPNTEQINWDRLFTEMKTWNLEAGVLLCHTSAYIVPQCKTDVLI